MNNIDVDGKLNLELVRTVPALLASERHYLKSGDVLICTTNSGKLVGKCALFDLEGEFAFSNHLTLLRTNEAVDSKFLMFQLWLLWKEGAFEHKCKHWVNQSTLPRAELLATDVVVAPLNEQRRIVRKLEKLLSRVDAAQERLATIPRILKRFRQSVLAAACLGGLTADWREQNPNVESAKTYLKRNNSDAALLASNEIPNSWVCCKLENLAELITKGASPRWQGINYSPTGILFVTSENVGYGRMLLGSKKYVEAKFNELQKRSILKSGDLLTNIVGASIGRSAIYELEGLANINQAVALIRLHEFVEKRYLLNVLNSPSLVDHMHVEKVDVARANLSLKDVAHFPIPLPNLAEQQEIVRRVEALFETADALEARYQKAKAHVDKLKQSILAKAFRGELVPQDPNDEPASVLLGQSEKQNTTKNT
jgi:restriction endonuclease S subunit